MEIYLFVGCIGLFTGFISGLLGIGGGILMAPLLLYVPPLFGLEPLSMRGVAGLTIVMGLFGCLSGGVSHRKFAFMSDKLSAYLGASIFFQLRRVVHHPDSCPTRRFFLFLHAWP